MRGRRAPATANQASSAHQAPTAQQAATAHQAASAHRAPVRPEPAATAHQAATFLQIGSVWNGMSVAERYRRAIA